MNAKTWSMLWICAVLAVIAVSYFSAGCATPRLEERFTTWRENGTTASLALRIETGQQLWVGERHTLQTAQSAAGDIGKGKMAQAFEFGALVAALMSGNAPVATISAMGSILSSWQDGKTTSTAATATQSAAALATAKTLLDGGTSTTLQKFQAVEKLLK
jgi:hypothetical protein